MKIQVSTRNGTFWAEATNLAEVIDIQKGRPYDGLQWSHVRIDPEMDERGGLVMLRTSEILSIYVPEEINPLDELEDQDSSATGDAHPDPEAHEPTSPSSGS